MLAMCVCLHVCARVYVCVSLFHMPQRIMFYSLREKNLLCDPSLTPCLLELLRAASSVALQIIFSHHMGVAIKPESSGKVASALSHLCSPSFLLFFFLFKQVFAFHGY